MTVRDDLIAAKALIDTPEKLHRGLHPRRGELHFMQQIAMGDVSSYARMARQLRSVEDGRTSCLECATHPDIMALFGRAIAASEPQS